MKWICSFAVLIALTYKLNAQKGFIFGGGLGMGVLYLNTSNSKYKDLTALSVPNFRLG